MMQPFLYELTNKTSLKDIEKIAEDDSVECVYSIGTCWWSLYKDDYMPFVSSGGITPLDPMGSPLMQAPLKDFIKSAKENIEHYGEHGLDAFVSAFHGNVVLNTGKDVAFKTWDEYNKLINHHSND